jgi:hypothetical protein
MIFLWNRKEIYRGVSVDKFNEIRNILRSQDIKFVTKIRDSGDEKKKTELEKKSRKYSKIYEIYVHRKNYKRVIKYIR